jgi:hypothetical protein
MERSGTSLLMEASVHFPAEVSKDDDCRRPKELHFGEMVTVWRTNLLVRFPGQLLGNPKLCNSLSSHEMTSFFAHRRRRGLARHPNFAWSTRSVPAGSLIRWRLLTSGSQVRVLHGEVAFRLPFAATFQSAPRTTRVRVCGRTDVLREKRWSTGLIARRTLLARDARRLVSEGRLRRDDR